MDVPARTKGPRYKHAPGEEAPYETITVDKLTPVIGAEISGVDLSRPLSNATFDEIHRALAENQVIFFRDQHLTPQQHLAFGRLFGELHIHPAAPHEPGEPALMKIHADRDSPRANGEFWHSDVSCDELPPMGSILYIRQCPPRGGDTLFASMYAAYEALSPAMKVYLKGLTATHDGTRIFGPGTPVSVHPVIIRHPVTRREVIFVNTDFTSHINELPRLEGQRVLQFLIDHCDKSEWTCRFRWKPHSIAFWDNRCCHHKAIWDYWPNVRSGFRVQIEGEGPPQAA